MRSKGKYLHAAALSWSNRIRISTRTDAGLCLHKRARIYDLTCVNSPVHQPNRCAARCVSHQARRQRDGKSFTLGVVELAPFVIRQTRLGLFTPKGYTFWCESHLQCVEAPLTAFSSGFSATVVSFRALPAVDIRHQKVTHFAVNHTSNV